MTLQPLAIATATLEVGVVQSRYGNYTHAMAETGIAFQKTPLLTAYGLQYGIKELWTIHGFLQAADQASLVTACNQLEAAYAVNGLTITLLTDAGANARSMAGLTALGGTRVIGGVSYTEDGRGTAEFSTYRTYTITVEGMYPTPGVSNVLLAFSESVKFWGGGPRFLHLQPLVGLPQKQQTAQATPYFAQQRGSGIGLYNWPVPPGPIWPDAEHLDRRVMDPKTPKRSGAGIGTVYTEYELNWSYDFESNTPLFGQPTLWTGA